MCAYRYISLRMQVSIYVYMYTCTYMSLYTLYILYMCTYYFFLGTYLHICMFHGMSLFM